MTTAIAVILCILVVIAARMGGSDKKGSPMTLAGAMRSCGFVFFLLIALGALGVGGYGCWLGVKMFLALKPTDVIGGFILFSVSAIAGILVASIFAGIGIRILDADSD